MIRPIPRRNLRKFPSQFEVAMTDEGREWRSRHSASSKKKTGGGGGGGDDGDAGRPPRRHDQSAKKANRMPMKPRGRHLPFGPPRAPAPGPQYGQTILRPPGEPRAHARGHQWRGGTSPPSPPPPPPTPAAAAAQTNMATWNCPVCGTCHYVYDNTIPVQCTNPSCRHRPSPAVQQYLVVYVQQLQSTIGAYKQRASWMKREHGAYARRINLLEELVTTLHERNECSAMNAEDMRSACVRQQARGAAQRRAHNEAVGVIEQELAIARAKRAAYMKKQQMAETRGAEDARASVAQLRARISELKAQRQESCDARVAEAHKLVSDAQHHVEVVQSRATAEVRDARAEVAQLRAKAEKDERKALDAAVKERTQFDDMQRQLAQAKSETRVAKIFAHSLFTWLCASKKRERDAILSRICYTDAVDARRGRRDRDVLLEQAAFRCAARSLRVFEKSGSMPEEIGGLKLQRAPERALFVVVRAAPPPLVVPELVPDPSCQIITLVPVTEEGSGNVSAFAPMAVPPFTTLRQIGSINQDEFVATLSLARDDLTVAAALEPRAATVSQPTEVVVRSNLRLYGDPCASVLSVTFEESAKLEIGDVVEMVDFQKPVAATWATMESVRSVLNEFSTRSCSDIKKFLPASPPSSKKKKKKQKKKKKKKKKG